MHPRRRGRDGREGWLLPDGWVPPDLEGMGHGYHHRQDPSPGVATRVFSGWWMNGRCAPRLPRGLVVPSEAGRGSACAGEGRGRTGEWIPSTLSRSSLALFGGRVTPLCFCFCLDPPTPVQLCVLEGAHHTQEKLQYLWWPGSHSCGKGTCGKLSQRAGQG